MADGKDPKAGVNSTDDAPVNNPQPDNAPTDEPAPTE